MSLETTQLCKTVKGGFFSVSASLLDGERGGGAKAAFD